MPIRPSRTPIVPLPPPFVERRVRLRRAADRAAHREAALLARALDELAKGASPEARLGGLLDLLARTVGARRAAILAEGEGRRIAVVAKPEEDGHEVVALAEWLDAHAPRSRSARAVAGPASVARVVHVAASGRRARLELVGRRARLERVGRRAAVGLAGRPPVYWACPVPGSGGTVLGFEFRSARAARNAPERLPPALARHAAVALALVSKQVLEARELDELRAHETQRQRFVSTVVHELRTPLTSLGGYLDLLTEDRVADPADRAEFLMRSRDLVGALGELVTDLLVMSRLESGNLELELEPISGAEAGQAVLAALHPQALASGITLEGRFPSRLRTVLADRRRLTQVLTNLTGNALKFSAHGGRVELSLDFDGHVARYTVRDDGRGIPPPELGRIFEPFFRGAHARTVTGTGLGLSIARDLAKAMSGDVGAASVLGQGSAFVLALPASASGTARDLEMALAAGLRLAAAGLAQTVRPTGNADGREATLA